MRESTGTVVRARAPPLVPAPVPAPAPAPAPVPLSIPLCVPPALQSVAVSMPVCAPASSPRLDPWSVRVPVSVSISFCVLLPPSPAAHSVSVSIPVWAPASTPCLDLNPRSAGAPVSVLISFCVPAVPVSVAVSMPVVCAPRPSGHACLLAPRVIAGVPSQPLSHLSLLVHGDAAIQRLTPRVQIGPAPARRALPGLAEVSCIPLAVAHVPGPWSLEPPGLASIARSPTIPHIAPLHPLAFVPPVMSAPHVAAIPLAHLTHVSQLPGRSSVPVRGASSSPRPDRPSRPARRGTCETPLERGGAIFWSTDVTNPPPLRRAGLGTVC